LYIPIKKTLTNTPKPKPKPKMQSLPLEIQDDIVYLCGLDISILFKKEYSIKKHLQNENWYTILKNHRGYTIRYLYNIKWNIHDLDVNESPFALSEYIDEAVSKNDIEKIIMIKKIMKHNPAVSVKVFKNAQPKVKAFFKDYVVFGSLLVTPIKN
jgi:hypothetical protein